MSFNFKYLGICDVLPLLNKLQLFNEEEWQEHQYRQKQAPPHSLTNTLEIVWDKDSLQTGNQGKVHNNFYKLDMQSFLNHIKNTYISAYGKGKIIRILITRLKPHSNISPHLDHGTSLTKVKRTHIPLYTNPGVFFIVGDEAIHMKQGEIWEINNSNKNHAVVNNSPEPRLHLIIDYLPNDINIS